MWESRDRAAASIKTGDNLYTTYLVSPVTRRILPAISGRVSPNTLTGGSLLLALVAAWLFSRGSGMSSVAGAAVYQLSFVADCLDGQIARYDGTFTRLGALLDWQSDRLKELAVLAGMAAGAPDGWGWAAAVAAVLSVRSATTVAYSLGTGKGRQPTPAKSRNATRALRSAVLLPYGDRHLVLGLGATVVGLQATLMLLAAWGASATAAQIIGRLGRVSPHRDWPIDLRGDGWLISRIGQRRGPWHSALSASLVELSAVAWLLSIGAIDQRLGFLAIAATTMVRHAIYSDALTHSDHYRPLSWMFDPAGWETRTSLWLVAAWLQTSTLVVIVTGYCVAVSVLRQVTDLARRRSRDSALPLADHS